MEDRYTEYTVYDRAGRYPVAVAYSFGGSWTVENLYGGPTQHFDLVGDRTPEGVLADAMRYVESHFSEEYCYMRRTA